MDAKTLGKYELLQPLGSGGYGTVYLARESVLDVQRAVKILHPALTADPQFIARFRREAQTAAKLEHPHIVPVYELDEVGGRYFLAMKYLPGGSLKDRLERGGRLPYPQALETLRQIASALDYAHAQGLVHRDVKPGNILFEADGAARLADFGFAKALVGTSSMSLSASGGMIGTPQYIAPEIWRGKPATPATDVYSLACVFYEMLTGQALFEGESPPEVMTRHMLDGPQYPETWPEGVPEGIESVLAKALVRAPEERFAKAGEFVFALNSLEHIDIKVSEIVNAAAVFTPERSGEPDATSEIPRIEQQQEARPGARPRWQLLLTGGVGLLTLMFLAWITGGFRRPIILTPEPPPSTLMSPANASLGETWTSPVDGMVMAYISAGEFQMGSENGDDDEKPIHTISLDGFWMDTTEVTNAMYARFLNSEGNQQEGGVNWLAEESWVRIGNHSGGWTVSSGYENHPVIGVSWYGAQAYCDWAGRRLPTEAEWEKAARGGLERKTYPWGNEVPTCQEGAANGAQYSGCNDNTAPVASFGANGYGLFDMAGNVWEWVADWYDATYYQTSPKSNPSGPTSGEYRVLRGGSWDYVAWLLRAANRFWSIPDYRYYGSGFRCAR